MISRPRTQQTIACETETTGFGYWSGKDVRVEFRPGEPDTGVVFVRRDLSPVRRIDVSVDNRIDQPRRTTLEQNGAKVEMVEHILAALAALELDNIEVWVDSAEMPGCDGSSQAFVEALDEVGVLEQNATRPQMVVQETVRVSDGDSWVEAHPHSGDHLIVRAEIDYGDSSIGRQAAEHVITPNSFREELAAARTFLLEKEAKWLHEQGLGLHVGPTDLLVFGDDGPIENTLRFENECARHKALDVVGDLALSGCDIVGRIVAHCSGHKLNAELVRKLRSQTDTSLRRAA